jgi:hypothetical protein
MDLRNEVAAYLQDFTYIEDDINGSFLAPPTTPLK